MVDLLLDGLVPNGYWLVEMRCLPKKFAVIGLVQGKFWVVCGRVSEGSYYKGRCATDIQACRRPRRRFHPLGYVRTYCDRSASLWEGQRRWIYFRRALRTDSLHTTTERMKILNALQVFRLSKNFDE